MASAYPGALDSFTNPASTDNLNTTGVLHDVQHSDVNNAIVAVETELGVNPSGASSTVAARFAALQSIMGSAYATSSLTLTSSAADVAGASVTFSAPVAGKAMVSASFDFSVGSVNDIIIGLLNVDGTDETAGAISQLPAGSRGSISQSWVITLAAGAHTLKLRAQRLTGSSTHVANSPSTGFAYQFVPGAA